MKGNTVELFAGTESFSEVAQLRGYDIFTVEINENQAPVLCKDILKVELKDLPDKIDILWASPPCTTFSVAGRSSNYTSFIPNNTQAALGLAYVIKTLELIKQIQVKNPNLIWFIENPMGYLRKFPFMRILDRKDVWYCRYGDTRAKPTDIWTNLSSWIPKKCSNGNKNCHHEEAPRGSRTGTQGLDNASERSRIPSQLFKEIFDAIEGKSKEKQDILKGE